MKAITSSVQRLCSLFVFCTLVLLAARGEAQTDINRDGYPDIIWQNTNTGDVSVWYMQGANWTGNWASLANAVPTEWKIVGMADINGDGYPDIIWQDENTGDVSVWYMQGANWTGNWDQIASGVPVEWQIVGTSDINGDGYPDIIWQDRSTGDVSVWYMQGANWTGNWDLIASGIPAEWKVVGLADFNGDGHPDIIWQDENTGDASVWYMQGANWTGNWDLIASGVPTEWQIVGKR